MNLSVLCFRKIVVAKKFMAKKLGRVSKFSVEIFLFHSDEKVRRGTRNPSVLCFRKFAGREEVHEWEVGSITIFRRKHFVSQCRKNSWGNRLVFHSFRVSNKFMLQRVMPR